MRFQILWFLLVLAGVVHASADVAPTCHEAFMGVASRQASQQNRMKAIGNSIHWPDHVYRDYLTRVRSEFASFNTCHDCVFSLETILENLDLTERYLEGLSGNILLAGEGADHRGGLFDTIGYMLNRSGASGGSISQRGGGRSYIEPRSNFNGLEPLGKVIRLDLGYRGRTDDSVEGTVTWMPFNDESFDYILSHMVAHYLREASMYSGRYGASRNLQSDFIREVVRVLKPGGVAHLGPFNEWDRSALRDLGFPRVELRFIRIRNASDIRYVLVIQKRPNPL